MGINQSDDNFIARFCDVHDQKLINIFCHAIINSPTTEIRLATFTPLKLLGNMQFQVTLELLIDNMQKEMRDGTIRFYCISPTEKNVRPFVNFSREPKNALRNKLKKSKEMVQSLLEFSKLKQRLRIEIIWYAGIPTIQLCQISNHYFFRSFRMGQKQDNYSVFHIERGIAPDEFVIGLDNLFLDLEIRGRKETINWF